MFDPFLNAALQQFQSPILYWLFHLFTALGYAPAVVACLSVLYWGWNKHRIFGLVQLCVLSGLIEQILKEAFQMPRPFQVDPEHVRALDLFMRRQLDASGVHWAVLAKTSYGFPSGHAQVAVCLYGGLALHLRRRGTTFGAVALISLIPLSRLYLGVHFLGDVLGGLLIGGVLLASYAAVLRSARAVNRLVSKETTVVLLLTMPVLLFFCRPDVPSAQRASFLVTFTAGYFAEQRWVRFSTDGSAAQRVRRAAVGLLTLILAYLLLTGARRWIEAHSSATSPFLSYMICYGAIALMASLAIPVLFVRTELAGQNPKER